MSADATAIARRLTPAQKRALLWLPADWDTARMLARKKTSSLYALQARGLATNHSYGEWWSATKLGLRVRALLEQERTP